MNYYFITGTSKGLGKALTELILQDKDSIVYGFSRNCSINHKNYIHKTIDFSDTKKLINFSFPSIDNASKITLINNAGLVGEISHLGSLSAEKIIQTYTVNLIAPSILSNCFVQQYKNEKSEKLIVNISSGAGRTPIDGWSVYCATKSGLDMLSQVAQNEFSLSKSNTTVLSLAPGIIDTEMQSEIRKVSSTDFSNIQKFKDYKKNGDLSSAKNSAQKVFNFINNPTLAEETLCRVD